MVNSEDPFCGCSKEIMTIRARKILIIFISLLTILVVKLFTLSLGPRYATVGGYYEPYRTMKLSMREAECLLPFKIIEVLEEIDFPDYKVTALTPKVVSKKSRIENYQEYRFNIWWLRLQEPLPDCFIQELLKTWKSERLQDNWYAYGQSIYYYHPSDPNVKLNVIYNHKGIEKIRVIETLKTYE